MLLLLLWLWLLLLVHLPLLMVLSVMLLWLWSLPLAAPVSAMLYPRLDATSDQHSVQGHGPAREVKIYALALSALHIACINSPNMGVDCV